VAKTTRNNWLFDGPDKLDLVTLPGVSTIASNTQFVQTYSTANKTVTQPSLGLTGADYASDFNNLTAHIDTLAANINAIIDCLQAHGLAT